LTLAAPTKSSFFQHKICAATDIITKEISHEEHISSTVLTGSPASRNEPNRSGHKRQAMMHNSRHGITNQQLIASCNHTSLNKGKGKHADSKPQSWGLLKPNKKHLENEGGLWHM
jgi:hypothetical protein